MLLFDLVITLSEIMQYYSDYQKRRKDNTKKDVQYSIIYNRKYSKKTKSSRMG